MYNRYIPQPDGTHRRNCVPEPKPPKPAPIPTPPPCPPPTPVPPPTPTPPPIRPPHKHGSNQGFLQHLIPKDFDTGDLIVILLLLLMAGDCDEDRNIAILTIALYFLM